MPLFVNWILKFLLIEDFFKALFFYVITITLYRVAVKTFLNLFFFFPKPSRAKAFSVLPENNYILAYPVPHCKSFFIIYPNFLSTDLETSFIYRRPHTTLCQHFILTYTPDTFIISINIGKATA